LLFISSMIDIGFFISISLRSLMEISSISSGSYSFFSSSRWLRLYFPAGGV